MDAAPAAPKRRSSLLWVFIPLLLVLAVGVFFGWEIFRDELEKQARERQGGVTLEPEVQNLPPPPPTDRKSREVVVGGPEPKTAPEVDELPLAPLDKKQKKPVAVPKEKAAATPADRAWRSVRASFEKLEQRNGSAARKFNLQVQALGDQRGSMSEGAFTAKANALNEKLLGELERADGQ